MSTLISSIARVDWLGLAGPIGRRTVAAAVPLLAAGALVAGCGSAHTGGTADAPPAHGTAPAASSAASATAASAPASASASAAPAASASASASASAAPATPVPTISDGPVVAGQPACVGWPTGATSVSLPVSFVPVSVERCVNGAQTIPGKGLWTTATLERADSGLAGLINALRQPSATRQPGTLCPALAEIPPQVVLIGANGQKLIPRLPATGCGLIQSGVLVALGALRWQPVSVRLIAKISGGTAPTVSGAAPHSIQTVGGAPQ
jgi:hypothetical protein